MAGKPNPSSLEQIIRNAAQHDPRVRLHLEFIASDRLQLFLNAADLIVLPYTEILNSGSALLALSFNRPMLVPSKGSMSELQKQTGNSWVKTYDGTLTPSQLKEAMHNTVADLFINSNNNWPILPEWLDIATTTYIFYNATTARY